MKKRLARRIAICVVATLVFSLSVGMSVLPIDIQTRELGELDLSIDIPENYSIFTRGMDEDDPLLEQFGTAKEGFLEYLEGQNVYLAAITDTYLEEIAVTMLPNVVSDLSVFSDATLESMQPQLMEQLAGTDLQISDCEIYKHSQAKFFKMHLLDTRSSTYCMQYYTIRNSQAISIIMRSYSGEITQEQEETLQSVVDSIEFHTESAVADIPSDAEISGESVLEDKTDGSSLLNAYMFAYKFGKYLALFLVALPIIIVIIVVRKKKNKKVQKDTPKAQPTSNVYEPSMGASVAGETAVLNADMMPQDMAMQPYLIRIRNGEKIIISTQMFRIGKDPSCVEYCISDNVAISRSHAYIANYDGAYWLVDNNSTNCTYVNGMMLPANTRVQLVDGTRIHLADEEFEFKLEEGNV